MGPEQVIWNNGKMEYWSKAGTFSPNIPFSWLTNMISFIAISFERAIQFPRHQNYSENRGYL